VRTRTRRALSEEPCDWQRFLKPERALAAPSPAGRLRRGLTDVLASRQPTVKVGDLIGSSKRPPPSSTRRLIGQAHEPKKSNLTALESSLPCDSLVTNSLLGVAPRDAEERAYVIMHWQEVDAERLTVVWKKQSALVADSQALLTRRRSARKEPSPDKRQRRCSPLQIPLTALYALRGEPCEIRLRTPIRGLTASLPPPRQSGMFR